jgi:hypothetical protein
VTRGRNRCTLVALVCGILLITSAPLNGQTTGDVAADECCLTLLLPVGARALALGGALTARRAPDGIFVNPASVANLPSAEVRIHSAKTEIERSTAITALFGISDAGTLAFSYRLVDYGDIDATDEMGNPTGRIRIADQALNATFATEAMPGVRAGVTYTLFQFSSDCTGICGDPGFQATSHALNLGLQVQPSWVPYLDVGASLNNLGQSLQVRNAVQAAEMPTRIRLGAAYELLHLLRPDSTVRLWSSVDCSTSWHAGVEPQVSAALELAMDNTIFVRSSWASGEGRGTGAAVGMGLVYDRFEISVAKAFVGIEDAAPIQVSLAVRF